MGCTGLTSLDLSSLISLKAISHSFLTTLDLTPFSNLTGLPEGFLKGCGGLKTITVSPTNKEIFSGSMKEVDIIIIIIII